MNPTVLLVDDEREVRRVLTDTIGQAGFDIRTAISGLQGIEMLDDWSPDLFVVDLKMPGMSGLDFAKQARKRLPDSELIILTGFGDMKSAVEAVRIGAYDYLSKPVDLDRLLQTLRRASERRHLVLENRDLLRRTQEANRIKGEFINGMSHEVRTPLGHITGFTQLLQDMLEGLTDKQRGYLQNIHDAAERLLDMFENILQYSMLKSGDVSISIEETTIDQLFELVIDDARPLAAEQGVELKVDPNDRVVAIDASICRRVVSLLVDNAIKFSSDGKVVTLTAETLPPSPVPDDVNVADLPHPVAGWLAIHVADEGIGIAEEDRERIFGTFTQADSSLERHYEGSGIGLALALSLARLHGGAISLSSEVGKGSTFTLFVPTWAHEEFANLCRTQTAGTSSFF